MLPTYESPRLLHIQRLAGVSFDRRARRDVSTDEQCTDEICLEKIATGATFGRRVDATASSSAALVTVGRVPPQREDFSLQGL